MSYRVHEEIDQDLLDDLAWHRLAGRTFDTEHRGRLYRCDHTQSGTHHGVHRRELTEPVLSDGCVEERLNQSDGLTVGGPSGLVEPLT